MVDGHDGVGKTDHVVKRVVARSNGGAEGAPIQTRDNHGSSEFGPEARGDVFGKDLRTESHLPQPSLEIDIWLVMASPNAVPEWNWWTPLYRIIL